MERPKRAAKKPEIYQAQEEDSPKVKKARKKVSEDVDEQVANESDVESVARNTTGIYEAQHSMTSRAKCRDCLNTINKGDVRIGEMVQWENGDRTGKGMGWWHMMCFFHKHTDKMRWEDFNGVEDLSVEDQKKLHLKACKFAMPNVLVNHVTTVLQTVQVEEVEEAAREEHEEILRKETLKDSTTEEVIRGKLAILLETKTVVQLKDIIKKNGILIGKTKSKTKKSKKHKALNKIDYQNAIVVTEPLCKIGSLVQRVLRKHMNVDELKILLEKKGLGRKGTKLELIRRLLGSLEGDFGEESEEETKKKKDFDFDDCYMTRHGIYEKDEEDPDIVKAAHNGDLDEIKEILRKAVRPVATLNASRKWEEVEEKSSYDKSWEWHGETPLLAAARGGHHLIVHYLLTQDADPTLEGCSNCDGANESPIEAVKKVITQINDNAINQTRLKKFTIIENLLEAAGPYWDRPSYSSSHYSDARKDSFTRKPNKPNNSQQLQIVLAAVSLDIGN